MVLVFDEEMAEWVKDNKLIRAQRENGDIIIEYSQIAIYFTREEFDNIIKQLVFGTHKDGEVCERETGNQEEVEPVKPHEIEEFQYAMIGL